MRNVRATIVCSLFAVTLAISTLAQTSPSSEQGQHPSSIVGTVVSVSRQTMVVRTDDNQFRLLVFENDADRPKGLTPGIRVRVVARPTDETGVEVANSVTVLEPATTSSSGQTEAAARPPKELSTAEREIERQARRWKLGARIGAGLDPELFSIGVHTSIGPIFSRDFVLRPNAEFAFGELTDMFALNLEGAYRLPITLRQGRWSAYVGTGPGLNFSHQGVDKRDFSFSNFDYETSLNVFTGIQFRRGTFAELKATLWAPSVPTLRVILGYTF